LAASAQVLDRKHWHEDINSQMTFGENKIRKLLTWLQLNERDINCGFRGYLIERTGSEKFKHFKSASVQYQYRQVNVNDNFHK
jgi:hypothetical protein